MKSDNKRIRNLCFSVACIQIVVLGAGAGVRANPTITVTWDCAGTPVDPDDYEVTYTDPAYPDIELVSECDTWKIKSVDGQNPGDIGEITATGANNYGLEITDGSSGPGARHVQKIDLDPSDASKYSNLTGGQISGDLTGDLFVQESSGESGGSVSFTVGGNVEGDITVPTISSLSIGGDLTGDLAVDEISGALSIGDDSLGTINIGELSGSLTIADEVSAPVEIVSGGSGTITAGTVKALMKLDTSDSYDGTATFAAVDASGYVVTCGAAIGGTIHVTGNVAGWISATNYAGQDGLEEDALIDIDGDLSGYVTVSEDAVGDIEIGGDITATGVIHVHGDISGDVTVDDDVDGEILGNLYVSGYGITGDVTIDDEFNGNICADNLSPMDDLPEEYISIGTFGDDGLICGARPWCGDGTISSADPADETQDSRQPHPPSDCSLSARQGIGSEDEPIEITLSEGGANNLDCWELCETDVEDVDTGQGCSTLSANVIDSVTETSTGVYEIVLERPISAGEWTTITYLGDDSYVAYASLPSDANADEYTGPSDITALIDYLNEVAEPPYGDYSCDMDHSTVCGSPDILRLMDLRSGAGKFIAWSSKSLPSNTCP